MLKGDDLVARMIDVSIRYPGLCDDACVILEDDSPCSVGTSTRERVDADGEAAVTMFARAVGVFGVAGVPARDGGKRMAGSGGTAGSRVEECGKGTGLSSQKSARQTYVLINWLRISPGLAITTDPEALFVDDLLRGCLGVKLRLTLGGGSSSKSAET